MNNFKINKTDNKITIEKLSYSHVLSNNLKYITIAEYDLINKIGYVYKYTSTIPKEYKNLVNWKKAVKRIFDFEML